MRVKQGSKLLGIATTLALSGAIGPALALSPGDTVDNFRLLDHTGASRQLYYLSDMKAVVLMAQGNGCEVVRKSLPEMQALRDKYRAQGVELLMINSNLADTRDAIEKEAKAQGIDLPILLDETQIIGESLGLKRNGELLVINTKGWKVAYRGPVSAGGTPYAANALDAVINATPVKTAQVDASKGKGCDLKFPEADRKQAHANISYEKTIAPMLIDNCVTCHRQGGIGPWQMTSYDMIKGFSPMIREVVRTERMPPWHADPHYNVFSNDRSLSKDEIKKLVHWIEAGSPRGGGSDPLKDLKKQWPEWALGEPDLIVEIPAFDVPATGVIPYQMPSADNPLGHDVWVRAVDFQPGDRTVLHHIIATMGSNAESVRDGGSLGGYVPGAGPMLLPAETGVLIKKDAKFFFQMHYTVSGKPARDVSRMGLYFRKDAPQYQMRSAVLLNPRLKIPANTKEHTESASKTFDHDVIVYNLLPHSHFRGKASDFIATYPDGRTETLLSVPNYDFNWQTTYELKTPKLLPAGTKVTHHTTWDNSAQNKANPDPNREVPWGQQTWDEMLYGVVRYRYVNESDAPTAPPAKVSQNSAE
ncbi:redoxin domain-containing protein [Steroidobacter flavus]|uniref:Redoxin domain-containing protein n=1 Tax=Steroidobacter flavus TaxID=1842136 RepID=A0ABV8SWB9_9GAMM